MHFTDTFIIADNQAVTRAGIKAFIKSMVANPAMMDVVCKRNLIDALTLCGNAVVILDYTLFDLNGIDDFKILSQRFSNAIWLLFSTDLSDDLIIQASQDANAGIVMKDCSEKELSEALTCAVSGERYLCHQASSIIASSREYNEKIALTASEIEILKMIASGMSVKEIAAKRVSSTHTITTHKKNIFRKLGINNVYEATKYALRAGLVELSDYYI